MKFPCNIGLAPLAGYTNLPFRKISYEHGACFAFTEMISARSVFESPSVVQKMLPAPDEPFTGVQIFGADLYWLKRAFKELEGKGAFLDLNAGCPVRKVIKKGMGGALLEDLRRFERVLKELREVVKGYLTVKTRLGWDKNDSVKICEIAMKAGVDAIFIHARTVRQGFSGKADWKALKEAAKVCEIPLFVSGDLFSPEDAKAALELSGADGVLLARGAIGNPWLLQQTKDYLEKGNYQIPTAQERIELMKRHLLDNTAFLGERKGVVEFRKLIAGYTKGLPNARTFRSEFMKVESLEDALRVIEKYQKLLETSNSQSG